MATAPVSRKLNLTRDQLAAFLTDHQQIKQFELLFSVADTAQYIPDELAEVSIVAGSAQATANQALAELSALAQDTAVDDAVLNAKVQQALDAIPGLAKALKFLEAAPVIQNNNSVATDYIDFNSNAPYPANKIGRLHWNGGYTLNLDMTPEVNQSIGEAQYYYIKASAAIAKGQLVMFDGSVGASGVLKGKPSTGVTNGQLIMGVAAEAIANNGFGLVSSFGLVRGFNTTGTPYGEVWADGDILYYNPSFAGGLTKNLPAAPLPHIVVAAVVNAATAGSGSVFVRVQAEPLVSQLSDVYAPTPSNGDVLVYDAVQQRWENAPISTAGAVTSVTGTSPVVSSGGTTPAISLASGYGDTQNPYAAKTANYVLAAPNGSSGVPTFRALVAADIPALPYGTGTVTSVSVVSSNGFAGTVANASTTPAITMSTSISGLLYGNGTAIAAATISAPLAYSAGTLSITQSGAASNGYLSSTDWNTFNNKGSGTVTSVAALTLGTTGTDLSSTVANSTTTPVITLNVPTASATNRGALSSTDWTTFNNKEPAIAAGTTAQYWRGDKTWQDFATAVRDTVLTGLSTATNAVITAADTVLSALGKLQKQISDNLTTLTNHTSASSGVHGVTGSVVGTTDTQSLTNKTLDVLRAGTTGAYKFQAQTLAAAPYYGTVAYWPADAGSNQQAYRVIGRNGGSNILLTIEKSTTTQSYGADPSLLSYSEVYSYNDTGVFSVASGIKFPATQVASADANTLDDYEEGSWSPTVTAGSGSITSYSSTGTYTKVGRVVTISCYIQITNNGTGGSYLNVAGLPFTIGQQGGSGAVRSSAALGTTAAIQAPNGGTSFTIWRYDNTYPVATNSQLNFSFSYFV